MKIETYIPSRSSFLSLEKDLGLIVEKIGNNPRIQRLLYYSTPDCLERENLTEEQKLEVFKKDIKIVPKLTVDSSILTYLIISFDNFAPSENPEFRDNIVEFDIVCHLDQWQLKDYQLRPYKIAGEIDSMFNDQHLTGIGELKFASAKQIMLTEEYAGVCLMYTATHGGEDKKRMPNPNDEERFLKDFEEYIKNMKE